MPTGRPKCPICQGKGTLTENTREYEFITRDPITAKCMICNGEGWLNPSTRLPNGKRVFEVFRKDNVTQKTGSTGSAGSKEVMDSSLRWNDKNGKRLNVSKKAVVNPETVDTGVGYAPGVDNMDKMEGMDKPGAERPKEPYEAPMFLEMALNPRLNKVLASGKEFLIVTETEPYYLDVYRMIRKQEKKQGTWTQQDEERYVEVLEEGYDSLMLDSSLRWNDGRLEPRRRASESINTNKEVSNG